MGRGVSSTTIDIVGVLRARTPEMIDALRALVEAESPTSDAAALAACSYVLSEIGTSILGKDPVVEDLSGHPALTWSWGPAKVLLIGHFDTVWP